MRLFINEYTKVLAYAFIGLIFAYCSFYLIANIYHYQEIRKNYIVDVKEMDTYQSIIDNIDLIEKNIDVKIENYRGSENSTAMVDLRENLSNCVMSMDNEYLKTLSQKKEISIKDVETLRGVVTNSVVNGCLIENMYHLTYEKDDLKFMKDSSIFLKQSIDTINSQLDFRKRDILNNSSFYFNTNSAYSNVYNKTGDNFLQLLSIYEESTELVLSVSSKFNNEVIHND